MGDLELRFPSLVLRRCFSVLSLCDLFLALVSSSSIKNLLDQCPVFGCGGSIVHVGKLWICERCRSKAESIVVLKKPQHKGESMNEAPARIKRVDVVGKSIENYLQHWGCQSIQERRAGPASPEGNLREAFMPRLEVIVV